MSHLEKLYRQVAAELDLPLADVERICRFQFSWVVSGLADGNYSAYRLPVLGSFQPIPTRIARKTAADIKKNFQDFGFHCC